MRFSTLALAATAGVATAQNVSAICDKYTTALLKDNTPKNQFALVALLVKTAVIGNFTGPGTANPSLPGSKYNFSGLLAPGMVNGEQVMLAPYFTGALASTNVNGKPTAVNWLDGQTNTSQLVTDPMFIGNKGSMQYTLLSHLVSYFGALLGCSGYGSSDFPAYAGSGNQYEVHKYMDISENQFKWFIQNVAYSAQSFGAAQADITAAGDALNTLFGYRCAAPAVVIPSQPAAHQVMCTGEGCPLSPKPEAGCNGEAAVAGFTASSPSAVSMSATASGSMSGSMSGSATGSAMATASGAAASASGAAGSAGAAASSAAGSAAGNFAPRQTAAAGLMAGAAAVAAALL